ncbi:hypothetical protein B5G26_00260 [Anaerotignum lactatifermentans]|uniref:Uncharacterized protein n=1 Tax=Anaerotignum lactatifermentans TaxID=160404 RepID=A0A1Y3UJF3_9FIRM|nr:hypothetical protein [Anaerotignum lactatifermentans]OUN45500.1 hypothetical protein B5G26_00260 [Anaerotignum lactatifermentans]
MSKRTKKIRIITQWLDRCATTWNTYTYGNIPANIYRGACTYAGMVDYEDVFGIIDETVFGSAKKGVMFTEKGWYSSNSKKFIPYSDLRSIRNWAGYNCTAFNEVLEKLYEIETGPSGWEIAGQIFGAILDEIDEYTEKEQIQNNNIQFLEEKHTLTVADLKELKSEIEKLGSFLEQIDECQWQEAVEAAGEDLEVFLTSIGEIYELLSENDLEELLMQMDKESEDALLEVKTQIKEWNNEIFAN